MTYLGTCMLSHFSHVQFFVTLWTVAHQISLSMGFSRQEYWSGLPFPSPGGSPQPRDWTQISHIAGRFFTIWVNREALRVVLKTDRGLDQLWMRKKEAGRKRRLFKNAEICWLYDTYIYKYIFNVYLIYTNMCECVYMYVCAYICACI